MKLGLEEWAYYQKYRPKTISECILPKQTKAIFENIRDTGNLDIDLLLSGSSGVGKSSVALSLLNELNLDHLFLNSSLKGNIDTLRYEISEYASSVSFDGKRKVVFLDEADNLTPATQLALRAFMEEFSSNCSYILTCNYANRIIDGIRHSRMAQIEFVIPKNEQEEILKQYILRSIEILRKENIQFEAAAVALLCKEKFADFRGTLNALQKYAKLGKIDVGVVATLKNDDINNLGKILKSKNFNNMKKWVNEHMDIEPTQLSNDLYEAIVPNIIETSIPDLILIRNKYDYQNAFVGNRILNVEAMLVEIMREVKFK